MRGKDADKEATGIRSTEVASLRCICSSHDVELFMVGCFSHDSNLELTKSCSSSASRCTSSGPGNDVCLTCSAGDTLLLSGHDRYPMGLNDEEDVG